MQESICNVEGFDNTLIPVEILSCDVPRGSRSQDALSIVELGKQLLLSAKNGDKESVRDLMCRGAPFTTDWLGTSALHLAAQNNHIETAEILLRAGISRDARTKVDRTPLHMAAYEGHHEMVQLLLNYGADVDSRDMLKMTPLHWAVENECAEVIKILLEHGADVYATSKFDKSPINLAIEHQRFDFVDMLNQEREMFPKQTNVHSQTNIQTQFHNPEIEITEESLVQLESEKAKDDHNSTEEQLQKKKVQVPINKKPRLFFQQIQVASDDEPEKELGKIDGFVNASYMSGKNHKDMSADIGVDQPFQLLQAHGITMIPVENDSIVENAMESGRTVVLTEAGKLALNLTKANVKRIQVQHAKKITPRKVITIRADQIISQGTNTVTSRSPNILKKNADHKNKTFLTTIPNTQSNCINSIVLNPVTKTKTITNTSDNLILHLDDEIEEITEEENNKLNIKGQEVEETDIAVLSRELAKARKQAEEYRKALQKKVEEAESYKQQLRNLFAQRAMK